MGLADELRKAKQDLEISRNIKIKSKITPEKKVAEKEKTNRKKQDHSKFEPMTSWYRGAAELLQGTSVRGSELKAITVLIKELEKRKIKLQKRK